MTRIADLHCDTVLEIQAGADLGAGNPRGHIDLPRMEQGNLALQFFACFVSSELPRGRAWAQADLLTDMLVRFCEARPGDVRLAETAADVELAWADGRRAVVPAVENGHAVDNDPSNLERLRRKGVRYMTLTHSKHLSWAGSSAGGEGGPGGLTALGREMLAAMNDLGIIADVSHVDEETFWDVANHTRRPFIASHSNASAVCPTPRNLTDDQIRAVADDGGMVGVNFFPGFLDPDYAAGLVERCGDLFDALDRIEIEHMDDPVQKMDAVHTFGAELRGRMAGYSVGLERIVDHLAHIVDLVGDDHVGFGADLDGVPDMPQGFTGCDGYPAVVSAMALRGFATETIEKICWKNALRLLDE